MLEMYPGWMTAELEGLLRQIDADGRTRNTAKKWRTVLVLAEGAAQGQAETALLRADNGTCTESTWKGKGGRRSLRAWSRDPAVVKALAEARRLAVQWQARRAVRSMAAARERLQLEALGNVEAMMTAREGLLKQGTGGEYRAYAEAAKVAAAMLDRAGEETADKSGGVMRVEFVRREEAGDA